MKSTRPLSPAACSLLTVPLLLILPSGTVSAQTLPEALDTPELVWTSGGPVEAVIESEATFDGVDAVRLNPDPVSTSNPESWIQTTISQPSILTFRHRSRDLAGTTNFTLMHNGGRSDNITASFWKQERLVVLPGVFRITNQAYPTGNPLYIDTVTVTPALTVPLSDALEAPGVEFSQPGPDSASRGIADAAAPDGVDAVWLHENEVLVTEIAGPAVVSFAGTALAQLEATPDAWSELPVEFAVSGRRQFGVAAGTVPVGWRRNGGSGTVDQLRISPPLSYAQALDSTGLVYEYGKPGGSTRRLGAFASAEAPAGAKGGHAVAMASSQPADGCLVIRELTGPGILKFSKLGFVRGYIGEAAPFLLPNSTEWERDEIAVPAGTVNLKLIGIGWLDDVSWVPGGPDLAALIGQPGADVTLPYPGQVAGKAGATGTGDATGLELMPWYGDLPPPQVPLLRIACQGPAMVSFTTSGFSQTPRNFSADGGPNIAAADSLAPGRPQEFALIFPDALAHSVEINDLGIYSGLKVQPLVEASLSEALDAPNMVFTTSPATPWRGYKTESVLGAMGGHAACGGVHAVEANPWIETRITGPGIVRFAMARSASDPGDFTADFVLPLRVTVNGATAVLQDSAAPENSEVFVAAGTHTVRWTQRGSQVTQGKGTLSWLDQVSFTPSPAVSLRDALESGTRSWSTAGGTDGLTAVAWPPSAAGGTSMVFTPSAGASPTLSTIVERPCVVRFTGRGLLLSTQEGLLPMTGEGQWGTTYMTVPGYGPGLITFSAMPGQCAVLDNFAALTRLPFTDAGSPTLGENPAWHFISRSLDWLGNLDNPTDRTLLTPDTAGGTRKHYLEATVTGPCSFSLGDKVLLPDRGMRFTVGRLPFPGPHKIITGLSSSLSISPSRNIAAPFQARPGIPLGTATGAPDLTWETGGDVPWMGEASTDGAPLHAVTGNLMPGEVSWIETRVTGPGVLRWQAVPPDSSANISAYTMLWNGIPVPGSPATGYLHLPAGQQRIRWQLSADQPPGTQSSQELTLKGVALESAPAPSLQDFTGAAGMAFLTQQGQPFGPLQPWGNLPGWTVATAEGRSVLRVAAPLSVMPIPAGPGDFTMVAKTEGNGSTTASSSFYLGPYPWLPKTFAAPRGVLTSPLIFTGGASSPSPLPEGTVLLVDSAEFAAAAEVDLAEALDTPGLVWTSGSSGAAGWRGFSGHGAGLADDPDTVQCRGLVIGQTAWMQTRMTGPAKVNVTGQLPPEDEITGFTVEIDGAAATLPVRSSLNAFGPAAFSVPAGLHTVRLAYSPVRARNGGITTVISNVAVTPEFGTDIGALVEAPELKWQAANVVLEAAAVDTFEGGDALKFTPSYTRPAITTTVQGPGLLSARIKGSAYIRMDETPFNSNGSGYVLTEVPVPNGSHVIRFGTTGSDPVLLDAVHFQPLPTLTAAEALDSSPEDFEAMDSSGYAAGAFTTLAKDGVDCVVLYPSPSRRLLLPLPVPCKVSFYARTLNSTGLLKYGDGSVNLNATSWTLVRFDSDALLLPDGRLNLEASGSPVRIDNLTISPASKDFYPAWAASFDLSGGRAGPDADPDGDGVSNLLEHAFGSDPTQRNTAPEGTATQPGMPVYSLGTDPVNGGKVPELRYWVHSTPNTQIPPLNYIIETAADPSAGSFSTGAVTGWRGSPVASVPIGEAADGWIRMLWRSPVPVSGGTRNFVRIRVHAE
ncbi:MAG: hypothetical protein EOP86_02580 [Verrucomicrobiaceae bacterium]|nr:MAG: hypothetical protein EOP86_02580 [Verrucomicrobiaceae bacterium]